MTTTTGHTVTVDTERGWVVIAGDLDTMQEIPEREIDAACAAVGMRCTYEAVDATTYRAVRAEATTALTCG